MLLQLGSEPMTFMRSVLCQLRYHRKEFHKAEVIRLMKVWFMYYLLFNSRFKLKLAQSF